MVWPRRVAIRFAERFQPVMKVFRLMTCAAIFGFLAVAAHPGAAVAMAGMTKPSAGITAGAERTPLVQIQYGDDRNGYDRNNGGHAGPGGPGWRGGWPGGWFGRPGWYGDPPGQPRNWSSQWGGGWYGGWYQPYWGAGSWASPNWVYGSPYYYGHYPAPNACGESCQEYVPLK